MVSFGGNGHDFKCIIRPFGTHCENKRNKDKSREFGSSGQGKQPWVSGRYITL